MNTSFPAGIDLLWAAFRRCTREPVYHGRGNIDHLRAIIRNRSETAAPSYTGAVEVAFSDADTITLTAEEVEPLLMTPNEWSEQIRLGQSLQGLIKFKELPINARLLETVLLWLRADVYGDLVAAEQLIAKENVAMYGTVGRDEALLFKRKWLPRVDLTSPNESPSSSPHGYNYIIDCISHVDVRNRVVVCPFECLIPGREGVGTEFLRMDPSTKLVEGAKCVRHASWD